MSPNLLPDVFLHEISCGQIFNKRFGRRSLLQFYRHIEKKSLLHLHNKVILRIIIYLVSVLRACLLLLSGYNCFIGK